MAHPMVRVNYWIRAGSFAYSFIVVGIHGWERGWGALFWAALVMQFVVYPHLAYLHARRAPDARRAETINLFADAVMLGAWIAALRFPVWLGYAAVFSTTLNATVVTGVRGGLQSLGFFAGGLLVAAWLAGGVNEWPAPTSPLVTTLSFVGSIAYSCAVGWTVFVLRDRLAQGRRELRSSEERFRLLAENAGDLIGLVDTEGRWLYTSPSYAKIMDAEHIAPGADAFARLHPDDASIARAALARGALTGTPRELSLRLLDREGRIRELKTHIQPIKDEERACERIVLVSRDVTDLREREERLLVAAHALEGMTEAIMITAADGTVVTVNRAFSQVTGVPRDEALGRPEKELRGALQAAAYYDDIYAAVQSQGYWSGSSWAKRLGGAKAGAVYREWRSVRAVRDAGGRPTHYVWVFYELRDAGNALDSQSQPGGKGA